MAKAKLAGVLKNSYVKTIILGIILLGGVFAFWFGLRLGLRTDFPLLAVASGSMKPTLNIGDLIIVQGFLSFDDINAVPAPDGTIVVFHKPNDPDELIVHRAIDKRNSDDGTWYFQTKGDNNNTPDYWNGEGTSSGWISQRLLVGKVVAIAPWIGNVPLFIRTPSGLLLIVLLFLVILFIEYVPVFAKKTKTKDEPSDAEVKNPES